MADADEDRPIQSSAQGNDEDLDDEVQDFRFLSAFGSSKASSSTVHPTLPRRGEKDFEPHGSGAQADALAEARVAMHDALAHTRTHQPRTHVLGTLDVATGLTRVHAVKGQHFRVMGQADRTGTTYLLPEEALYLLERGSLDVRWPSSSDGRTAGEGEDEESDGDGDGEKGKQEEGDEALPLSLQAAYALLIGKMGLTLERYQVFAGLRRSGYAVFRAPSWYNDEEVQVSAQTSSTPVTPWASTFLAHFTSLFATARPLGPLVKPGLYRSYDDIYKRLSLIPYHDPSSAPLPAASTFQSSSLAENPARICWHVWKPQPSFKKSTPGPPDFRLAVLDARAAAVLDLSDLDRIFAEAPPAEPPTGKNMFGRLKTGWRSAMLAVVDQGVVSYLKVSEGGFGGEKVYARQNAARGGKGGRGRGRGGGGTARGAKT